LREVKGYTQKPTLHFYHTQILPKHATNKQNISIMKNLLKQIVLIVLFLIPYLSYAQTEIDTLNIIEFANKSEYIFEGEVIEKCTYVGNDGIFYTNNIVQIFKIGKGNLNCGTISILTLGGQIDNRKVSVSHNTEFTIGFSGVFFCKRNFKMSEPLSQCNISTDNLLSLNTVEPNFSFIGYYTDYVNSVAEGLNSNFSTIQELYDFVSNNSPFGLTNCQGNFAKLNQIANYEIQKANSTPQKRKIKIIKKKTRSNDLIITMSNPTVTGNNLKYYEFDVNLEASNNNTYLDGNAFRIKFDTLAFDTTFINSMVISLIPPFSASTYNNITLIKKAYNVISIWNHHAVTGQTRTLITTTPSPFLHIKIPFKDCGRYQEIILDTFSSVLSYSFYANTATSSTYYTYTSVLLEDTLEGEVCRPYIESVIADNTNTNETEAGLNNIITIKGKHFLNKTFNSGVLVQNANDGGLTQFPIQDYDYLPNEWNDTSIKFNLHSYYNNLDTSFLNSNSYNSAHVGSGFVTVGNSANRFSNQQDITKNNLVVNYSISNNAFGDGTPNYYFKNNNLLFGYQVDGKYKFQCNGNITNDSMKWCISSAINRWRCLTGVNFEFDFSPSSSIVKSFDSLNIIMLSDTIVNLAQTLISSRPEISITNDTPVSGVVDIDMQIDKTLKYIFDTTGNVTVPKGYHDFFKTILHELGHAIQLNHVMDSLDLMYHKENNTTLDNTASMRNLNFNVYNNIAGDLVVYRSVNQVLEDIADLALLPMIAVDTCYVEPLKTINYSYPSSQTIVYPNPSNGQFNFQFSNNQNRSIKIFTVSGSLIKEFVTSENFLTINLNNLNKGIYIANISSLQSQQNIKLICE
jgi:Secretion system C-terminal sorting domain